jgi:hypothetical protein
MRPEDLACEQALAYAKDELATARNRIGDLEDEISVLQNEATTSFEREQTAAPLPQRIGGLVSSTQLII